MTTTDKPRLVVVCHPDQQRELQAALVEQGITDVLVQAHEVVDHGKIYCIDPAKVPGLFGEPIPMTIAGT